MALLVYVALRAWILATAFESVAVPVYEISTIGSYGWALSKGVELLPWSEHYDNAGAQILTAWLSAWSYRIFGASYLALKLVPLAFGAALLAMVGRMLARHFSGRAALIGMLSVAVAPPIVTKYSMLAKGNHFEGLTLLFVALWAALETPEPGHPRRWFWVAFTGLALGFSVSMYFGAMLTGPVLTVAWWIRFGALQSLRDTPAFGLGLGVGLIPFALINAATQGRAGDFGAGFASPSNKVGTLASVFEKGHALVTETLPQAACFEEVWGLSPRPAETLFFSATILSWCFVVSAWLRNLARPSKELSPRSIGDRRRRRAAVWILLAYPIGVLTVLTLKSLPIMRKDPPVEILGVRYLLGYFFFSLLLIAVAIDQLLRSKALAPRVAAWVLALALLCTWPFTAAIASTRWSERTDAAAYPGVNLRQYSILFHRDLNLGEDEGVDTTRMKACLENLSEAGYSDQRSELAMGIGFLLTMAKLGYRAPGGEAGFSVDAVTLDFDPTDYPDLLRGVGMCFHQSVRTQQLRAKKGDASPMRQRINEALGDPAAAPWVATGFGMAQQYPLRRRLPTVLARSRMFLGVVSPELRRDVLKGVALTLREYSELGLDRAQGQIESELEKFEAADQSAIRSHLGAGGSFGKGARSAAGSVSE